MPALFCAGAAGTIADANTKNYVGEECWELLNMRNTQYQFGDWPSDPRVTQIPQIMKDRITQTPI